MKKSIFLFFLALILGLMFMKIQKPAAETKLYVSEDLLSNILTQLQEIRNKQQVLESKLELKGIKELNIKIDRVISLEHQIRQDLQRIKVRI